MIPTITTKVAALALPKWSHDSYDVNLSGERNCSPDFLF